MPMPDASWAWSLSWLLICSDHSQSPSLSQINPAIWSMPGGLYHRPLVYLLLAKQPGKLYPLPIPQFWRQLEYRSGDNWRFSNVVDGTNATAGRHGRRVGGW